jgi:hypothetical protein
MYPKAVLEAQTALVHRVLRFEHPADRVVADFFREQRALGARDRRELADGVFALLRKLPFYRHLASAEKGGGGEIERPAAREPFALALVERRMEDAGVALPGEHRQATVDFAPAAVRRAGEMAPERQLPQQREDAVGEDVALARAERSLLAEEVGNDTVGRVFEAQHPVHELGLRLEQRGRMHAGDYPCHPDAHTL